MVSACATVSASSLRDPEARDIPVVLALCGVRISWDLVYRMWSVGIRCIQILMSFKPENSKSFTVTLRLYHALSLLFFSRLTIFLPLLPSLCCCRYKLTWGRMDSRAQQGRRVSGVWLTDQWWAPRERVKGQGQRLGCHGEGESRAGETERGDLLTRWG